MGNLYLFDGNNLAFRAFVSFANLTHEGTPIGAVYGVVRMLQSFVREYPPGKIVMAFDTAPSIYRKAIYPEYKQGKARTDPKQLEQKIAFKGQLAYIIKFVEMYGITTFADETKGWEADDVIAFLCAEKQTLFPDLGATIILSSDRDLCALVKHPKTTWIDPISKRMVSRGNFKKEFEVTIEQYRDYKVLVGDTSDNVPHPRGLGEKTAIKLLAEYGNIGKMKALGCQKLTGHDEVLELASDLVTLDLHERIEDPVWDRIRTKLKAKSGIDPELRSWLETLDFESILETWDDDMPRWEEFNRF